MDFIYICIYLLSFIAKELNSIFHSYQQAYTYTPTYMAKVSCEKGTYNFWCAPAKIRKGRKSKTFDFTFFCGMTLLVHIHNIKLILEFDEMQGIRKPFVLLTVDFFFMLNWILNNIILKLNLRLWSQFEEIRNKIWNWKRNKF